MSAEKTIAIKGVRVDAEILNKLNAIHVEATNQYAEIPNKEEVINLTQPKVDNKQDVVKPSVSKVTPRM